MYSEYLKETLCKMDVIDVYKMILQRKYINDFPYEYWNKPNAKDNSIKCIKWLIEEKLKWNEEQIKNNLSIETFKKNYLYTMLQIVFDGNYYAVIKTIYPNIYISLCLDTTSLEKIKKFYTKKITLKNLQKKHKHKYKWTKETCVKTVKWLIEEQLKWTDEDIRKNLSVETFYSNNLRGLLKSFNGSPYKALNFAYPNKFKPWELKKMPHNYWTNETCVNAIKWLIEEQLKWTDEDIRKNLSVEIFYSNNLRGFLNLIFNGSPYKALNFAYPNKFKPWELKKMPSNYWTNETCVNAIKWLIEERLKWNDEDIRKNLSIKVFKKNNLYGLLILIFNGSPYNAINTTYPERFKPWEMNRTPSNYWTKETSIIAVKWLLNKLELQNKKVESITKNDFCDNKLGYMLNKIFHGDIKVALNEIK